MGCFGGVTVPLLGHSLINQGEGVEKWMTGTTKTTRLHVGRKARIQIAPPCATRRAACAQGPREHPEGASRFWGGS